jgi:hypothetical protein
MKSVFNPADVTELTDRINKLTPETKPQWGKMTVGQMLAHCNVAYEMAYTNKHPKPGFFLRLLLKYVVKSTVCGDKPYKKNSRTAPAFLMTEPRDFYTEKVRLLGYLNQTLQLGEAHFDGKESLSFGKLSIKEWDTMFYKHLNHHLEQFGV